MNEPATRNKGGRPKGSKTKYKVLSNKTCRALLDEYRYNPVWHLTQIARGRDKDFQLPQQRFSAINKLADLSVGKGNVEVAVQSNDGGSVQLAFLSPDGDFALPGETSAESDSPGDAGAPIRDSGMSPAYGQDGLCD